MVKVKAVRTLYILLAVSIITAVMPLPGLAARVFTDVGEEDWFGPYVLKAYEAGLISGYEDATFKPNQPINKVGVIACLSRLAGMSGDPSLDVYRAKYNAKMDAEKIPVWAKDYIAFALEKGILTEEELATFVRKSDGALINAKRYEVAIYFTKALGLEQEARSNAGIILAFRDNELISAGTRGYIKALVDRNIISGDPEGRFNPNDEITRAQVATMLAASIDFMGSMDSRTPGTEGRIEEVVRGTGRTIIKISLADGSTDIYDVAANPTVRLDGAAASLNDIAVGQQGTFGIKDDRIVSIDVASRVETVEGVIRGVLHSTGFSIITLEKDNGDRVTFRTTSDTVVRMDGTAANVERLGSGDRAAVTASNTYAIRVEAESKNKTVLGIFGGFKTEKKLILILRKGNEETEYPVNDGAKVKRDGKTRELQDLRKGDQVELTTEYGIVVDIKAESVDREVEGTIYSLLIARPHQLTIMKEDGDTETFMVPVDVSIKVDGKPASIYDLRLDYRVEVDVESDEIISIDAEAVASQNEIIGTVEYVNTNVNVITMKVLDPSTNTYVLRQININDRTRIVDKGGTRRYLRHISPGNRLIVVGHSELGVFIADTIMITN